MRIFTIAVTLGLLIVSQAAVAQGKTSQAPKPEAPTSKAYNAEEASAASDAARKKSENLAKARDRRMKMLSRSICSGC